MQCIALNVRKAIIKIVKRILTLPRRRPPPYLHSWGLRSKLPCDQILILGDQISFWIINNICFYYHFILIIFVSFAFNGHEIFLITFYYVKFCPRRILFWWIWHFVYYRWTRHQILFLNVAFVDYYYKATTFLSWCSEGFLTKRDELCMILCLCTYLLHH